MTTDHGKILYVDASQPNEKALAILKVLASDWRLRILQVLGTESYSVNRLAQLLDIPLSTTGMHVKLLEEAELIQTKSEPASRGTQKTCSRRFDRILIELPPLEKEDENYLEVAMPIGAYVNFEAEPTCGLASETNIIGIIDDPTSFLEPERVNTQILWFHQGFVEYKFPCRIPPKTKPRTIQLRMEICSEAPTHNDDWPSDITLWINGIEVGTWTSPADYGGTRGALTPSWWLDVDTQYGQLKRWEVNASGTYIDGVQVSEMTIDQLKLEGQRSVSIRIGVKPDSRHVGGLNLFGKKFGNYPEDLMMRIWYE